MIHFDLDTLRSLLRRPADDPAVSGLIGVRPDQIVRSAYQGFVELRHLGISVMFKEAPWVIPADQIVDPKALHLSAFHLHREGHEQYSQYRGFITGGAALGDSEADLIRKLGSHAAVGGGQMSKTLKRPVPRWLRYFVSDAALQFQLDEKRTVEMVTLHVPDI